MSDFHEINPSLSVNGCRWDKEAFTAAESKGYRVAEFAGTSDYQGWGALLLCKPDPDDLAVANDARQDGKLSESECLAIERYGAKWAVLSWGYGSCSGCDAYEEMAPAELASEFASRVTLCETEADARLAFSSAKGW